MITVLSRHDCQDTSSECVFGDDHNSSLHRALEQPAE